MQISLHSSDTQLYHLCRSVLTGRGAESHGISLTDSSDPVADSDLIIWDYFPENPLPADVCPENAHRYLFLVRRQDLDELRSKLPRECVNILLKPCSRPALGAFLERSLDGVETEHQDRIGWLREDRDEILQSLLVANVRLQEYDQDRTAFLTRTVHDFRAPLTALSGYCGLLLAEQLGPLADEQRDVLRRMLQSTRRLSLMADAMFDLGIQKNRDDMGPQLARGELRDCLDQALHEMGSAIDEKNLGVSVDIVPCPEPLLFDSKQIERVFVNLLDNACRFTPKGGSIEVRVYPYFWDRRGGGPRRNGFHDRRIAEVRRPNAVRVDLCDSGPGVPPEYLGKIFEEYTSYSGPQDRSCGGLGLAICKMIINRHGGRMWAEATSRGTVFAFVLPLQPVSGQES